MKCTIAAAIISFVFGLSVQADHEMSCPDACMADVMEAGTTDYGCGAADMKCMCSEDALIAMLKECASTCTAEEADELVAYGINACAAAGVTIEHEESSSAAEEAPAVTETPAATAEITETPAATAEITETPAATPLTCDETTAAPPMTVPTAAAPRTNIEGLVVALVGAAGLAALV
ncbi:hypothetical protein MKZ38_002453 [Zalerion maritima]|uniref:CFEM domain-containing protein n=1 Tax=Zalerion maritima TaxID=339359 RepID=A0AAD5RNW2_9PEZI|nr:hypothetical protein MKZ38_002453 [Zalerion maritima]